MSPDADRKIFRILSLDGGGIRGVFPAALLARLEEHLEHPIGRYFDLIAGTSTGGIIAIGLGLGLPAREILKLYVEQGPAIFDQQHGTIENWVRRKARGAAHFFVTKHPSTPLRRALEGVLGHRMLGESQVRLVVPAWHPMLERVYIYKTAHHPRLETDYKQPAIDAAMATAAAPTFLKPHMTESWRRAHRWRRLGKQSNRYRRNRFRRPAGWPADRLKILSIGTINEPGQLPKLRGKLPMAAAVTSLFMAGQSHSALGTAKIVTGDVHERKAIWCIDQTAPEGRYTLDNASQISEMRDRAFAEAREQLPELKRHFFDVPADPFVPFHKIVTGLRVEQR